MTKLIRHILCIAVLTAVLHPLAAQERAGRVEHITKKYSIFFRVNRPEIDTTFQGNGRTISKIREDILSTLELDGAVPDSLLILSTASPDGPYEFNRQLAKNRAASTKALLLDMFPQFKSSNVHVDYIEEDWDGLKQVLRTTENFPQREEMLAILENPKLANSVKKFRLKECKEGYKYLIDNYVYTLRNSSITITVVKTSVDEFARMTPLEKAAFIEDVLKAPEQPVQLSYVPMLPEYRQMIFAPRTNFIAPGLNVGVEVPIGQHWSVGLDYWYPWYLPKSNRWCTEMLGLFADVKYWFPGKKNEWTRDSKLKGHAVGLYFGAGYYDYQNNHHGNQGEYIDFGVDYTYALPIAHDRLRLEFNIGLGMIRTIYRPYTPTPEYDHLIKDFGIKHQISNFLGPTRAGVSLVVPIYAKDSNPFKWQMKKLEKEENNAR